MVGENPGGYNQYAYVLNNPVLFDDPTGHKEAVGSYKDEEDDTDVGCHVWTDVTENYNETHAERNLERDIKAGIHPGQKTNQFYTKLQGIAAGQAGFALYSYTVASGAAAVAASITNNAANKKITKTFMKAGKGISAVGGTVGDLMAWNLTEVSWDEGVITRSEYDRVRKDIVAIKIVEKTLGPVGEVYGFYKSVKGMFGR